MSEESRESSDELVVAKNKLIYFFGEINSVSAGTFIHSLHEADSTPGLVTIFMFSGGGEVHSALAMYDSIKCTKNQVLCVGIGEIASAAVLPFVAADARLMYPNAQIFLHETRSVFPSDHVIKQADLIKVSQSGNELFETYCRLVTENSRISIEKVRAMCEEETYLSPTEAGGYGLCDGLYTYNDKKESDASSDLGKVVSALNNKRKARKPHVRKTKKS